MKKVITLLAIAAMSQALQAQTFVYGSFAHSKVSSAEPKNEYFKTAAIGCRLQSGAAVARIEISNYVGEGMVIRTGIGLNTNVRMESDNETLNLECGIYNDYGRRSAGAYMAMNLFWRIDAGIRICADFPVSDGSIATQSIGAVWRF